MGSDASGEPQRGLRSKANLWPRKHRRGGVRGAVTLRRVGAEEECGEASGFAQSMEEDFPLFIWVLKNKCPPMTGSLGGHQRADICIVFLQISTIKIN